MILFRIKTKQLRLTKELRWYKAEMQVIFEKSVVHIRIDYCLSQRVKESHEIMLPLCTDDKVGLRLGWTV